MEEDDDDFGPLYVDNLRQSQPQSLPPQPSPNANIELKRNVNQEYGLNVVKQVESDEINLEFGIEDDVNDLDMGPDLGPVAEAFSSESEDDFDILIDDGEANGGSGLGDVAPGTGHAIYEPYDPDEYQVSRHSFDENDLETLRPGVAPMPKTSFAVGYGTCDWQPAGIDYVSSLQKLSELGSRLPSRGHNEFLLPSDRTIFEVDIDSFKEKPWRLPGINLSFFFNYDLNEESWKDYRKQLLMYCSSLPQELAEPMGAYEIQPKNVIDKKMRARRVYVVDESREVLPLFDATCMDTGFGDRLPSFATRPIRASDHDAIIEIVLQGSEDSALISQRDVALRPLSDELKEDYQGIGNEHSYCFPNKFCEDFHGSPPVLRPQLDGIAPDMKRCERGISCKRAPNTGDGESNLDKDSLEKQNKNSYDSHIRQNALIQLYPTYENAEESNDKHGSGLNDVSVLVDQSNGLNGEDIAFTRSTATDTRTNKNVLPSVKKIPLRSLVVRSTFQETGKERDFSSPTDSKDNKVRGMSSRNELGVRSKGQDVRLKKENHDIFENGTEDLYSHESLLMKTDGAYRRSERNSVDARQQQRDKFHRENGKAEDTRKSEFGNKIELVQEYSHLEEQHKCGKCIGQPSKTLGSRKRIENVNDRHASRDDHINKRRKIKGEPRDGAEDGVLLNSKESIGERKKESNHGFDISKRENDDWYYKLKESKLKCPLMLGKEGRRGRAKGRQGGQVVKSFRDGKSKNMFIFPERNTEREYFQRRNLLENISRLPNKQHGSSRKRGSLLSQKRAFTCYDRSMSGPVKKRTRHKHHKESPRRERNSVDGKGKSVSPPRRHQKEYSRQMNQQVPKKGSTGRTEDALFQEGRANSEKGRSKFERWTGDREFTPSPKSSCSSLKVNWNIINNRIEVNQSRAKEKLWRSRS